jgi:hypothetical protein
VLRIVVLLVATRVRASVVAGLALSFGLTLFILIAGRTRIVELIEAPEDTHDASDGDPAYSMGPGVISI